MKTKKKSKIRVILIGPSPFRKGGIASVARHYLNSDLVKQVDLRYISSTGLGMKLDNLFTALKGYTTFLLFLIMRSTDIIHILVSGGISFYRKMLFILLARIFKNKIILHLHASNFEKFYQDRNLNRYFIKKVMDNVDLIFVLSENIKNVIKGYTINKNIKVLFNPISSKEFSFPKDEKKPDPKIVLFMGELGKRKGIYDLLEATPRILQDYDNVKFVLCGDGELEKVRKICKNKNMENKVDILGYVSGQQKMTNFKSANIYILPSYHEGLPVSILEAMACGLPIVSTPIAGIPDAVEDGVNGLLIEPGNIDGIAEKVTKLLKDDELCARMSQNNVNKVREKFDIEVVVRQLVQEYENLLNVVPN